MMGTERRANPLAGDGASRVLLVWVDPAYARSPPGARMPRPVPMPTYPPRPRPAVDGAKLKAVADRLAGFLNELQREDWHVQHDSGSREWSIIQAPGGAGSAKAVVGEDADGWWETSKVSIPLTPERRDLVDRLRALAAEVEAL